MLFNSYEFIFVFFPIVLFLFYLVVPPRAKMTTLLICSYCFYGYWNYKFIPLIIFSTYADFYLGQKIHAEKNRGRQRILLFISVAVNLGVLGFFKYFNFAVENLNFFLQFFEYDQIQTFTNIVLPVGISFYTFQSMSYTIDLYRNHSKPYRNFISFATYVSLFPQLIAGPIVRHSDLVPQLEECVEKPADPNKIALGIYYFVIGLAKKIIIADNIALAIDPVIGLMDIANTVEAWACALGYTLQLYFDFSGYSDMAIGLALILGVKLPQNFNSPYKAYSITDFWRRWHMTLSAWLRDYLYISLGGSKKGHSRTYCNLFLTMLLGGLWHGAAWTYIIWGCFHGLWLAVERFFGLDKRGKRKSVLAFQYLLTFFLVIFGWVIFRAENMSLLSLWLNKMFIFQGGFNLDNFTSRTVDRFAAATIIGYFIVWKCRNTFELEKTFRPTMRKAVVIGLLFFVTIMFLGADSPFLYFQF